MSAGSAGVDVPELADFEAERTLGAVRFMKTIRARHKDGLVIAKVFIKPYPNLKLEKYTDKLLKERRVLADVPNVLPYHRILETATNGYLARQYIHSSLYDRISTNPSLEEIERKWIAYQLLCAVRDSHAREIFHGDIKTENMLVTTWNWLYLTDFSSAFKPTRLPEDNPATFSIFFDTTGRRICYVAPERFSTSAELKEHETDDKMDHYEKARMEQWHKIDWAMDIFSVGCVIAELFTEKPTFTLSQLFKYRKGEYDPTHTTLNNIKDEGIREMAAHMIQLDPEKRLQAHEYLDFWRTKSFPEYFYTFLHQYMHLITDPTSGRAPVVVTKKNSGGSDDRIERIYSDFDKISYFLSFTDVEAGAQPGQPIPQSGESIPQSSSNLLSQSKPRLGSRPGPQSGSPSELQSRLQSGSHTGSYSGSQSRFSSALELFPLQVDLPGNCHNAANRASSDQANGALLFLNVIVSSLRSTARASSRIRSCELLLAFGERLTDEAKLDRVLPYAIALLEDESENVRIAALRTITQLLAIVTVLSPMNVFIFPNYVLPRLQRFVSSPVFKKSAPLRATYVTCLASLATTASRFLDMMQALRADGSLPSTDPEAEDDVTAYAAYQNSYDSTRQDLIQHFEAQTKLFLTDDDPSVRRAFLGSVTSLCVFFGDTLASDLILTHLNTYLNDGDWMLKCAFFETIVGVAAFIGGPSLEDFILPLMVQALTDPEETVTEQVVRSLSSMTHLGLFQRWTIIELVITVARFTFHPNMWIREAAVQFIAAATTHLSEADAWSMIMPIVRPLLKVTSAELTELELMDALKKPFPRSVLDMAKTWADKTEKGVFWKPAQQRKSFSFETGSTKALMDFYQDLNVKSLAKSVKNDEDESWLNRLRVAGLRGEDEAKLLALREYVWRSNLRTDKDAAGSADSSYDQIVPLTSLKIPLQTVLFDNDPFQEQQASTSAPVRVQRRTIEDALRDAATLPGVVAGARNGDTGNGDTENEDTINTTRNENKTGASTTGTNRTEMPASAQTDNQAGHTRTFSDYLSVDDKIMNDHRKKMTGLDGPGYLSSSPTSTISVGSRGHNHTLHHKGSAVNLLKRAEVGSKAGAETGTDSVNAVGTVDLPVHPGSQNTNQKTSQQTNQKMGQKTDLQSASGQEIRETRPRVQASHSYRGGDPNVLKLLDAAEATVFPLDTVEFGPQVQSIKRMPLAGAASQANGSYWKPQGQLVAVFGEHQGQVNCIAVAPDHAFFVTGSDDGTVRIWDTARLEKNLSHRSRQVHKHSSGAKITSICFVEQTHSFISAASDGSLDVVKVDFSEANGMPRYGKLSLLREWKIPSRQSRTEYAVGVEHSRVDGQSLCMVLTNLCRVLAVDLQTLAVQYELQNPVQHGTPTSFCVQRRRQWLVIGTAHGVLDLWDLRFRLRLRSWTVRNPCPISEVIVHPAKRSNQKIKVCVAGLTSPGHVGVWDLEKVICNEVYQVSSVFNPTERLTARDFELLNVDEEKSDTPGRILGAVALDPKLNSFNLSNQQSHGKEAKKVDEAVIGTTRSFVMSMHVPSDGSEPRHPFLISAGPDWKIRFWDSDRLVASMIVNGDEADEKPVYSAGNLGADIRLITEKDSTIAVPSSRQRDSPSPSPSVSSPGPKGDSATRSEKPKKKEGREGKVSRYDVIRASAQQLLKGHKDTVTAVALIERPFGMIVSADRSGIVYVFM